MKNGHIQVVVVLIKSRVNVNVVDCVSATHTVLAIHQSRNFFNRILFGTESNESFANIHTEFIVLY